MAIQPSDGQTNYYRLVVSEYGYKNRVGHIFRFDHALTEEELEKMAQMGEYFTVRRAPAYDVTHTVRGDETHISEMRNE